jgi:hypothetical protein
MKPLPEDFRRHLLEISGNEIKVWMFYYLSTGDELTAYPSIETIAIFTGLSERTVKVCKRRLVIRGWLAYTGETKQPRGDHGYFGVPIMELRLPWKPDWLITVRDASMAIAMVRNLQDDDAASHRGAIIAPPSVVQTLHPEGSIGLGLGLDSFDLGSRSAASPPVQSESKEEREPTTLEPTAATRATPTPTAARGHGQDEGKRQKKTCSKCGAILTRDENHLLTCPGAKPSLDDECDEFDAHTKLDDPDAL